ncbi:hypothetical protein T492DRAFT_1051607 [Pavlovales sp. CCMP2436]|nr:hypothetical protein T492DRAFT_1051607 [Pavlovales sp. CCMP2436]
MVARLGARTIALGLGRAARCIGLLGVAAHRVRFGERALGAFGQPARVRLHVHQQCVALARVEKEPALILLERAYARRALAQRVGEVLELVLQGGLF